MNNGIYKPEYTTGIERELIFTYFVCPVQKVVQNYNYHTKPFKYGSLVL